MAEVKTAIINDIVTWYSTNRYSSNAQGWLKEAKRDQSSDNYFAVGNATWNGSSTSAIWRTKIKFTVNSGLIISQADKLVVKILSTNPETKPTHIRAFLSKTNHSGYNPSTTAKDYISKSLCYEDENGDFSFPDVVSPYATCYFVFKEFEEPLKAGQSYYIYLHAYDEGATDITDPQNRTFGLLDSTNTTKNLNITLHYASYTRCSAPSSIIATSSIQKNGQIKISWSGAAGGIQNPIKKYRVYYNINLKPIVGSYCQETTNASTTEITIPNSIIGAKKKDIVYFKIVTIGSVDGYDSALSTAFGQTQIINSAPTKPTVTLSGPDLSSNENNVAKIMVTDFRNSTDIDGDGLGYYYQVLSSIPSSPPTENWEQAAWNFFEVDMNCKYNILAIKVTDGEASVYEYFTKPVNSLLEFTTPISVSGESYAMLGITDAKATEKLSVSAAFSKKVNGRVQLSFGDSTYKDWKTFSNVDKIDYKNESIKSFQWDRGKKINVQVILDDGIDQVSLTNTYTNLYFLDSLPMITEVTAVHEASEFTGYKDKVDDNIKIEVNPAAVGTKITFTGTIQRMRETNIPLTKIEFFATDGTTEINLGNTINNPINDTYNDIPIIRELNVTGLDVGKEYYFGMRIFDSANNSQKLTSNTFHKLNQPTFSDNTDIIISPQEWNIYESSSFSISFQNLDNQDTGVNTYTLHATINDKDIELISFTRYTGNKKNSSGQIISELGTTSIISLDTLQFYIPPENFWEFFQKFKIPSNSSDVTVKYSIEVKNGVNISSSLKEVGPNEKFKVITRAKTEWKGSFQVARGYCSSLNTSTGTFIHPTIDTSEKERIINPKECLRLFFDQLPTSPNSNSFDGAMDTSSATQGVKIFNDINIYYATSAEGFPNEDANWRLLTSSTIDPTILEKQKSDNKYYYDLTIPKLLAKDEGLNIYFRATVTVKDGSSYQDKTINMNEEANTLIYGRTEPPTFSLVLVSYAQNQITFKFNNEEASLDFGGLKKGYSNFTREDSGKYELHINYGSSLEDISSHSCVFTIFDPNTLLIERDLIFAEGFELGNKLYYQAKLVLYPNDKDSGFSQVYTLNDVEIFYLGGPTVQVRKHTVGINTTQEILGDYPDGVIVVTNYDKRNKVVFKNLESPSEITLDLSTYKIHGIVLDGGSW